MGVINHDNSNYHWPCTICFKSSYGIRQLNDLEAVIAVVLIAVIPDVTEIRPVRASRTLLTERIRDFTNRCGGRIRTGQYFIHLDGEGATEFSLLRSSQLDLVQNFGVFVNALKSVSILAELDPTSSFGISDKALGGRW